ncbi:MAG: hypothetical protein Q9216_005163 [Gyalolechia sp. 2 TL-2023]
MGAHEVRGEVPKQGQLALFRSRHRYLYGLCWIFLFSAAVFGKIWTVLFATWPSMHDPVSHLLNTTDVEEADNLTEKWTKGKLKELQYVGLSSAMITGTIAAAFSWYSVEDDPWTTEACWTSALVLALTAISLATQQTIGLSRLSSCENGWLKVRHLLGKDNPDYGKSLRRPHKHAKNKMKMKTSQLWMWQTPVMLSNFSILLFVVGLMISIFARAARTRGDWTKGQIQVSQNFSAVNPFVGRELISSRLPSSSVAPQSFQEATIYFAGFA